LNLENRDLNRRNLRSMLKISHAACLCLISIGFGAIRSLNVHIAVLSRFVIWLQEQDALKWDYDALHLPRFKMCISIYSYAV